MFSFTVLESRNEKFRPADKSSFMVISTIALILGLMTLFSASVSAQEKTPVNNSSKNNSPAAMIMGPLPKNQMQPSNKAMKKRKSGTNLLDQKLRQLDNVYVPIHWSDPRSGMAIGGHDPISYFEFQKRMNGNDDFQLVWHGVAWRFNTSGNMKMFKKSPSSYAPAYAGYDPYSVSQGVM